MSTELTYLAKIEKALSRLGLNGTKNPDSSNTGSFLGDYFLWNAIKKHAEKKLEQVEDQLSASGLIATDPSTLTPGNHVLVESEHFVLTADVTKPVSRFDKDLLAENLEKSKYKIPRAITIDFLEKSKREGKSMVRRKIAER